MHLPNNMHAVSLQSLHSLGCRQAKMCGYTGNAAKEGKARMKHYNLHSHHDNILQPTYSRMFQHFNWHFENGIVKFGAGQVHHSVAFPATLPWKKVNDHKNAGVQQDLGQLTSNGSS